jgi:hypothetical protein
MKLDEQALHDRFVERASPDGDNTADRMRARQKA